MVGAHCSGACPEWDSDLKPIVMCGQVVCVRVGASVWGGGEVAENHMELREHVSVTWPFQDLWLG